MLSTASFPIYVELLCPVNKKNYCKKPFSEKTELKLDYISNSAKCL